MPVRYALVMVSPIWPPAAVAVTLSVTRLSDGAVYDAWYLVPDPVTVAGGQVVPPSNDACALTSVIAAPA